MAKKQTKFTTLLSTLANGATSDSRRLLIAKTGKDARNTQDLTARLAKLYADSEDKIEIEKLFAAMHPHKDFILKYSAPKKVQEVKETTTIALPLNAIEESNQAKQGEHAHEKYVHNTALYRPACQCHECNMKVLSSADGSSSSSTGSPDKAHVYLIAGSIAIVAILGLIVIHKHGKHA